MSNQPVNQFWLPLGLCPQSSSVLQNGSYQIPPSTTESILSCVKNSLILFFFNKNVCFHSSVSFCWTQMSRNHQNLTSQEKQQCLYELIQMETGEGLGVGSDHTSVVSCSDGFTVAMERCLQLFHRLSITSCHTLSLVISPKHKRLHYF